MSKLEQLINELCPDGVEYIKLGDKNIFDFHYGKGNSIPKNTDGKFPVYGCNGVVSYTESYNCENVSIIGHIGSAGIINRCYGKCYVTYNGTIANVVDESRMNKQYFYYILKTLNLPKYVKGSQPFLSVSDFDKVEIPLPPLPVQEEIVRILDTFTELTAELTAELTMRKQQYEYYRDSLFTFGEEVEWKTLGEKSISDVIDSLHKTPSYADNSNFSMIRVTDIKEKYIDTSNTLKVTEDIFNEFTKKYKPKANDLVMSRVGSYGNISIIPSEGNVCMGQNTVVIIPKISYKFLYHYLNSYNVKSYIEKNISGGSQKTLSLQAIRLIPIPNINNNLIDKIVDILDRFDTLANDIKEGLPAEIAMRKQQYEYYRDKLLTFKKLEA